MQAIRFDPESHKGLIDSLVNIHSDCITKDGTIATFLPPLNCGDIAQWWTDRANEVASGIREIIMVLSPTEKDVVAGVVMLSKPFSQTGPFRGIVEKLLVSPDHRRCGIARVMMAEVEVIARETGRTLLLLDTVTGTPAEKVYARLGYTNYGNIAEYGISPLDGSLQGATFFYKNLLSPAAASTSLTATESMSLDRADTVVPSII